MAGNERTQRGETRMAEKRRTRTRRAPVEIKGEERKGRRTPSGDNGENSRRKRRRRNRKRGTVVERNTRIKNEAETYDSVQGRKKRNRNQET